MNATLVSREERVTAPHGSRADRTLAEQVEHSVRQRRIVGNKNARRAQELRHKNPILAIPADDAVLKRDDAARVCSDRRANTGVPVNNVVTHGTRHRGADILVKNTCAVTADVIFRNRATSVSQTSRFRASVRLNDSKITAWRVYFDGAPKTARSDSSPNR